MLNDNDGWVTGKALETVIALKGMRVGDQLKVCGEFIRHNYPYVARINSFDSIDGAPYVNLLTRSGELRADAGSGKAEDWGTFWPEIKAWRPRRG